jgi:uracil-DNA glycosylase family 4
MSDPIQEILAAAPKRPKVLGMGPQDAKVMIVGEAPGADEVASGMPFQGAAGVELTKLLMAAGIPRGECRITNVCKYRPPNNKISFWLKPPRGKAPAQPNDLVQEGLNELELEIAATRPTIILALGNTPLWALTGEWGVGKWGGSLLWTKEIQGRRYRVLPTYHPAAILRRYDWRYITRVDLQRAKNFLDGNIQEPNFRFQPCPTFEEAKARLEELIHEAERNPDFWLASDIETYRRHIDCIGFAWSPEDAICIPLVDRRQLDNHYWSEPEEFIIVNLIRKLLCTAKIIGQNWPYDAQYIGKLWLTEPNLQWDTMTQHHVMFAGMEKALHFLSRFYLPWHEYWKDEGQEANVKEDPIKRWTYNCKDCVATFAVAMQQMAMLPSFNFKETEFGTPSEIQQSLHEPVMRAILRGVKVDQKLRTQLIMDLSNQIVMRQEWINKVVGRAFNPGSPKQMKELFYDELRQKPVYNHKDGRSYLTCDADALELIGKRMPGLGILCQAINEVRELGNARAFCGQELDSDSRIRCSYSIPGTETYRFNSKKDAFGFGTNLQNVTKGHGDPEKDRFFIPNLRRTFVPDPGYVLGDFDLESADAQIVAMEAGSTRLLELFRDPNSNLHDQNADRWNVPRPIAKGCVHAIDYAATAYALSQNFGLTKAKAQEIIDDWFAQFPEIKEWQDRVLEQIQTQRFVENAFGYRRYYFGRIDNILKEALAWIPQSSVAIVTNLGIRNVYRELHPRVQFLLQVHDSAVYQWQEEITEEVYPQIKELMRIPIPYPDPLIIGVGGDLSKNSWGQVGDYQVAA